MKSKVLFKRAIQLKGAGLLLCSIAIVPVITTPSYAVEFEYNDISGSFDTTVSYGQTYRAQGVDRDIVAISNGAVTGGVTGNAFSANFDDGNTNFQDGVVSSVGKFTSELDLAYKTNTGAFIRVSGFKDIMANADELDRDAELTNAGQRLVGTNINLLDAYVWGRFSIGNMPAEIRVGEQVISWGESTFIQNSINVINPFDVSKLRVPGSELKEALRPVGMLYGSLGITDNISVEGFYQYDYENTELEPVGSYFSTNDFISDGGYKVQLGSGSLSDRGTFNFGNVFTATAGFFDEDFAAVLRAPDIRPDEGDQYGAAIRIYAPEINDTEFGLYYIKYHSRTPVLNVTSGSAAGATAAFQQAVTCVVFNAATCGAAGLATISAIDGYVGTANYFAEFRDDIDLFGASFSTELGKTGIALQGEYSFRSDFPLQIDDAELLAAGLQALEPTLSVLAGAAITIPSQLGAGFGFSTVIPGFIERDVSQVQMTATKIFGPMLKADQVALIGEFAVTHVHNMPSKDALRLEAPGTFTGGNPALTTLGLQPATESNDNFADATSWGYQIRGRIDYLNAIGAVNISPRFAWRHDVSGIAPLGLSGFREESKTITLGVGATYQNEWRADLSYTNFFGADSHNLLNDRDFVAFSIGYSF